MALYPQNVCLINGRYKVRLNLIDLNPIKLNCHPFMINIDECNGSCNVAKDVSAKICVSSKTKDVNVKVKRW